MLDEQVFEEQRNKAAKGYGLGIFFQALMAGDSLLASPARPRCLWQLDPPNLEFASGPMASSRPVPDVRLHEVLRLVVQAPERQASVMRFLCDQSILAFSSHKGGPP
jgi:hypothetical protein